MAIRLVDEVPCLLGPSHVALDPEYNFWKEYILRFLKTPPFKNLNLARTNITPFTNEKQLQLKNLALKAPKDLAKYKSGEFH